MTTRSTSARTSCRQVKRHRDKRRKRRETRGRRGAAQMPPPEAAGDQLPAMSARPGALLR